ncbi:hypothetical protein ACROYT_G019443 [Oculina patagonica]
MGTSSETSHNSSIVGSRNEGILDARNCTKWLPVNVTDLWGSCGVKYNVSRTWRCNETSHERLLIMFECTRLKSTSKCSDSKEIQVTEEPGTEEPPHDMLRIFLYGVASGACTLILLILLLSTVSCCLKKRRKNKSQCELLQLSHESDNVDQPATTEEGDYIANDPVQVETQNESRHEVAVYENVERNPDTLAEDSAETQIPTPYTDVTESGDISRDNEADELEDAAPFGRGYQGKKKSSKAQHPLYVNCNEDAGYMHLILETREKDDPTNLTTKPSKSSRRAKKKTFGSEGNVAGPQETKKPTGPPTLARPSSAEYVNSHMGKLYQNVR